MATGLPALSLTKSISRQARQYRLVAAQFELGLDAAPDHLLRRYAVDLLGPGANEFDLAARYDEGLETVRPQVGEQFQHRLIDHLGVESSSLRMPGAGDPVADDLVELLGGHPGVGDGKDPRDGGFAAGKRAFHIALERRRKRLLRLPFGMLRGERPQAIEGEDELEVQRLLGPQRAVIVEGGDSLGDGDEVRRSFLRHLLDERFDGLLGAGVVPGAQRIGGEGRIRQQQQSEQTFEEQRSHGRNPS